MPDSLRDPSNLRFHPHPECFDLEVQRIKAQNRRHLASLPPEEAQRIVDSMLQPHIWRRPSPAEMAWPGDLADEQPPYPWEEQ